VQRAVFGRCCLGVYTEPYPKPREERVMNGRASMQQFSLWLLALVLVFWFAATVILWCLGGNVVVAAEMRQAGGVSVTDPRLEMVTALKATRPHASLGDHVRVVARLLGTRDVEYTDFATDGNSTARVACSLDG